MVKLSPSEFSASSEGWLCRRGDVKSCVPDADGRPCEGSLQLANEFLEQQPEIEVETQRWLAHHLRLEGETRLATVTVLPESDEHGALLVLNHINMGDRYLWIDIGLSRHLSWLTPHYIFLKYH
jgi:hypothetical protein